MCYPGDVPRENSIPQWTLWFVAELYEFGKRGGDVEPFRDLVGRILTFFEGYENSDFLLEKLPYWNFVEWSRANDWVKDVNYPTNMLYYRVLKNCAEMYGFDLNEKAEKIREAIIAQSFDGLYFRDHAKRLEDGTLEVLDDRSAICQHEAFLFEVADDSPKFAEIRRLMLEHMGVAGDKSALIDRLEPLDLFIGFAVRVELLANLGEHARNLDEIKALYGPMSESTGTLWEHRDGRASLNHGFGSFIAVKLLQGLRA